jgi:hypothetical protein
MATTWRMLSDEVLARKLPGHTERLLGALRQTTSPSASAASQPMPEVFPERSPVMPRPSSVSSTRRRAAEEKCALPSPCSAAKAHYRAPGPASRQTGGFVHLPQALPNPSFNASPNGWPGLPFLGHFSYRPIQVMPGQPSGPR